MAELKVNLSEGLTDDVFQVHEEILDENSLFNLHILCDKILNNNPNAKFDGGFKIRLPESCYGTGSTLKEFWTKFGNATKYLSCLYLSCDQDRTGVMAIHSRRLLATDGHQFKEAAKDPLTFDSSQRNCCMQALDIGGPRAAVLHFYNCILSKAIVNDSNPTQVYKSAKSAYQERQAMVVENEPSLTCVRIERNMKDSKYMVQNDNATNSSGDSQHTDLTSFLELLLPINLKQDGDGENCSLYFNGVEETSDNYLRITSNFALAHLCHQNMLTDLPEYFSGVAYPFLYMGGLHSTFAVHIEDMSLFSINYNHFGYPKLIILIAPHEVSRLSLLLTTYGVLRGTGKDCIQQLSHKTHVVFPNWLLQHGIKFKVIIQHPGEFVVFAPNAAHTGGNMGPNLAEACNFGSYDWLPFGSVASQGICNCIESGVQFDVTQLIKDHRSELLPFHKNKSKWASFNDEHFQRSLIVPPRACSSFDSLQSFTSATVKHKSTEQSNMVCPVKACNKIFKKALKATLVTHLNLKHSDCIEDSEVQQYLEKRFRQT